MKTTFNQTNYWAELAKLGIRYGRDIVRSHDIVSGDFRSCLEYNGRNFNTAKEIFEFVSRENAH